jgi:predicted lipid carrier protein YhbT
MAKAAYLSQEWLDLHLAPGESLPERLGATARVQHVVTGTPSGEVRYVEGVVDGRLRELTLGDDPDADLTLIQTYADARQVAEGAVDAHVAFMQGRLKVVGSMRTVLALMPLLQSDEYRATLAQVAGNTDF